MQRILVVDDEQALARSLRRDLESALRGAVVDAVYDGTSAIALLRQRHYDVCIVDWAMSPVAGSAVVRAAKDQSVPALVLSGHMDVRTTVEAMKVGAKDVLEKPVHLASLLGVLPKARSNASSSTDPSRSSGSTLLLGVSEAMAQARRLLDRFASFPDVPVFITGETGTGKGVAARHLHSLARPGRPFVSINCAAIPESLLESELFGHEAGAFTNARNKREGLMEVARDGILFLDEIGEMSRPLQAKLLNVLEEGVYRRLGSNLEQKLKARLVTATNQTVTQSGSALREDLYFRLAGCTLELPPLRERPEDIDVLAVKLLQDFGKKHSKQPVDVSRRALDALHAYHWPGNVRELRRVVENAAIFCDGNTITVNEVTTALENRIALSSKPAQPSEWRGDVESRSLPVPQARHDDQHVPLREAERQRILQAFGDNGHNVSSTARQLGIPRSTLRDKLRRYGVA